MLPDDISMENDGLLNTKLPVTRSIAARLDALRQEIKRY
jgi:hypothetical protein